MMESPEFKRRQRVIYRRSLLCGRAPEYGIVVKRHPDEPNFVGWYHVRDEDRPTSGGCSEHGSMLAPATPNWREEEIARMLADAEEAARLENENIVNRWSVDDVALCPPFNVLSFCAGVGGLELGIRIVEPGTRCIVHVEREAAAAASLVASMEAGWFHPAPVWSDAGTFDARPWRGLVDCLASGDPCQPNSVAGKRGGASDDRWLIDQLLRIVDECRPARLFRENVPGNLDGQLGALVPALERMGYRVACGIFSAAEVGASHRRERFFLMADAMAGDAAQNGNNRGGRTTSFSPFGRWTLSDVADASHDHGRRGERGAEAGVGPDRERRRGPASCGAGSELADASDGQLSEPGRRPEGRDGYQISRRGAGRLHRDPMADPDDVLAEQPARHGPGSGASESGGKDGQSPGCRDDLPPFAPGPSDPRWPDILARAPELEPAVRRVADGLACRIERLRACGNGVVPLAAAAAWVALSARLAAASADSAGASVVSPVLAISNGAAT
jgi:DNA (cytosine-5)-methyltransferase 1